MFDTVFNRKYIISALVGARPRALWGRLIFALYFGSGILSLIAVIWLAAQGWTYGWQTSDWERLNYSFSLLLCPITLIVYGLLYWQAHPARLWPRYRFLRDALAEHASDLPEVIPSIEPLPPERLRERPVRFGALRRFSGPTYMTYLLLFGLFIIAIPLSNSLPRALGASDVVVDQIENIGIPVSFAFFGLPFLFLLIWWLAHERWRLQVTTDAEGLTWRWSLGRRARSIPWSSVRAFYRVSKSADRLSRPVYFLYFADGSVFSWVTTYISSTREYRETARLARIIVSCTGQPLRDADVFFERADEARRRNGNGTETSIAPALAGIITTYQRVQWRMMFSLIVAVVLFVALLVPLLALPDWGLQRIKDAQANYFAGLPAKLHSAPLLYANNMSANDGCWPVSTAGNQRFTFSNGAYQVSGQKGAPVFALIADRYADAAVEVTVRQSSGAAGSDAEAGLAFHAANTNEMLLFTINAKNGQLNLYLYRNTPNGTLQDALFPMFLELNQGFDYPNPVTPHYAGLGTANTLLVVMRGLLYLLYVNGQYVGQFSDKYDIYKPPVSGQVGPFVADGGDLASFTNFAVYGVKEPPALDYL